MISLQLSHLSLPAMDRPPPPDPPTFPHLERTKRTQRIARLAAALAFVSAPRLPVLCRLSALFGHCHLRQLLDL